MSHEYDGRARSADVECEATKKIEARVSDFLPGISERSHLTSLTAEAGVDEKGDTFYLRFKRLFDSGDIRFIANSLLDREPPVIAKTEEERAQRIPKRVDVHKVAEEDSPEYLSELEKIRNLGSDILQLTALDLFTYDRAVKDFLAGPQSNGRDYRRIFTSNSNDEVAHFMGEMAGMMKKRRDVWKDGSDHARVSDRTAISRYSQLSTPMRLRLHEDYLSGLTEAEQRKIIAMHMSNIIGAEALERDGETVGFFRGKREVAKRQGNGWATTRDGSSVLIFETEGGFRLVADKPNVLVGEVSWKKDGRRVLTERAVEPEIYEGSLRNLPEIELEYNIGQENVSRLLGVMILDGISNIRNRNRGKYIDGREIIEDCYARRNALLNTELIRNVEDLLSA